MSPRAKRMRIVFCAVQMRLAPAASVPANWGLPSISTRIQAFWLPTLTATVTPAPSVPTGPGDVVGGGALAGRDGAGGGRGPGAHRAGDDGRGRGGCAGGAARARRG